jgi:hypothetical protein
MHPMHERRLPPDLSQWVVQALSRLLATYAIFQGATIILGGPERWQGQAFITALTFPGAPASWGFALLTFGSLALAGTFTPRMRLTACALFLVGVWSLFFTITLAKTALEVPTAATTGVFVYGHMTVTACVLAVTYGRSRP